MKFRLPTLALIAATIAPGVAFAHTGIGQTSGFAHGFIHPISSPVIIAKCIGFAV